MGNRIVAYIEFNPKNPIIGVFLLNVTPSGSIT